MASASCISPVSCIPSASPASPSFPISCRLSASRISPSPCSSVPCASSVPCCPSAIWAFALSASKKPSLAFGINISAAAATNTPAMPNAAFVFNLFIFKFFILSITPFSPNAQGNCSHFSWLTEKRSKSRTYALTPSASSPATAASSQDISMSRRK